MRMKQTSVAMTTDTWPRLDWRVVEAIWQTIVAPTPISVQASGIVASVESVKVHATAGA